MTKRPTSRLVVGLSLLGLLAVAAIGTTTSAFAQVIGPLNSTTRLTCTAPPNSVGGTGTATTTSTTACSITPGAAYTLASDHLFASSAAAVSGATPSRFWQLHQSAIAYPRWSHAAGSHWVYLIARNTASAAAATSGAATFITGETLGFNFEYYAPPSRTTRTIASIAAGTVGGVAVASAPAASDGLATVFAQSVGRAPIISIQSMTLTSSALGAGGVPGFASYTLSATSRWGRGQEWWNAGAVNFHSRTDQQQLAAGTAAGTTGLSSGWSGSASTLTLSNSAPTQNVVGGGARTTAANVGVPYIVSVADANGDVARVRLRFKQASGPQFLVGLVAGDNASDITQTDCADTVSPPGWEYMSSSESYSSFSCGTSNYVLGTYLGATSGGAGSTVDDGTTGGVNDTAFNVSFSIVPSTSARGTWSVYASVLDFHGATTGEVLIGTLTVT